MATILFKNPFRYAPRSPWEDSDLDTLERRRNHLKATALLGFVVMVIAAVSGFWFFRPTDPCSDKAAHTHAAFLLDATDPFTADQARAVQGLISDYQARLPAGAHLSLYLLYPKDNGQILHRLFGACKPADGSKADPLVQSPHWMRRKYQESFEKPLTRTIHKLMALTRVKPAPRSPILEALHQLVYEELFSAPVKHRTLVIVSDLLQHNPQSTLSHFTRGYRFEDVANSVYVRGVRGRLQATRVVVYRLKNQYHSQHTVGHARFWEEYFKGAGVAELSFTEL